MDNRVRTLPDMPASKTLTEFARQRWGEDWTLAVTHEAAEQAYRATHEPIELSAWVHALLADALQGLLETTCAVDDDGRRFRIGEFLPREAAIAWAVLARMRSTE